MLSAVATMLCGAAAFTAGPIMPNRVQLSSRPVAVTMAERTYIMIKPDGVQVAHTLLPLPGALLRDALQINIRA